VTPWQSSTDTDTGLQRRVTQQSRSPATLSAPRVRSPPAPLTPWHNARLCFIGVKTKPCSQVHADCVHAAVFWGSSSLGRAPALQAGGDGFESRELHCVPSIREATPATVVRRVGRDRHNGCVRHGRRDGCLPSVCGFESRRARQFLHTVVVQRLGRLPVQENTRVRVPSMVPSSYAYGCRSAARTRASKPRYQGSSPCTHASYLIRGKTRDSQKSARGCKPSQRFDSV
jgi:hypothetical protein